MASSPFFPYRLSDLAFAPSFSSEASAPLHKVACLFDGFLEACLHAPDNAQLSDQETEGLKPRILLGRAIALGRLIQRALPAGDDAPVALMLPTSLGAATAFLAVQSLGRTVAMINFNAGAAAVLAACETARLHTIFTSRRFIEAAELGLLLTTLQDQGLKIVWLEDLRAKLSLTDKFIAALTQNLPSRARSFAKRRKADDPAVILFTSGSEGTPKGVVLSHRNILSNIAQFTARVSLSADDKVFACLPLFHSFGLTVGLLLPLLTGMKIVLYPSPLHYHVIPEKIRTTRASILLTTDTFLSGYARCGSKEDFAPLRYIVAGAEKLKETTRTIWATRFEKTVFEGYGATETSPVLSVNTPDLYCKGSVGQLLPGIESCLQPVPGLKEGGSLCVKGPNIMLGLMRRDAPGIIEPPPAGWYDTGDIATIDAKGYVHIQGRLKRFAKIGGEMVSLSAIEQATSRLWPDHMHAIISQPHARKGEALIMVTEHSGMQTEDLVAGLRKEGLPDLAIPRKIVPVGQIPILGAGKIDYERVARLLLEEAGTDAAASSLRSA